MATFKIFSNDAGLAVLVNVDHVLRIEQGAQGGSILLYDLNEHGKRMVVRESLEEVAKMLGFQDA